MAIASNIQDLVKELTPAAGTKPKTYTAEVSHTDEEGIVWVRLPGAEQDTPTASTSSEVKMGDTVTVEWRNNKLYIAGNYTNPSAGVERVSKVEQTAEKAMSDAETAQAAANSAQETANAAITIAGDTDQHFWFTETGTDTGAHITEATQEDFLADPTNGGGNLLARSNGIAVRDGLAELASFSASGASIGQDGELRFFVTPSSIALENDDDEPIFSVVEDAAGKIVRPAVVATFADPTDVSTTTYTISDSITASGAVAVFFETGGDQYALDSTLTTTTVTVGTGVTVALTTDGVDYCQGLMTESEASGVLSVEYYITHYDKALLDMAGSINVDGVGDIIGVANTTWTASNRSDTFIGADNTKTGKGIRVGVGTGGQNRGLYDKTLERWLIYADSNNNTAINGNTTAAGTITVEGHSSPIGDIRVRGMQNDTVVHTATGTALCALTLPAGTWSLVGFVRFPSNNTGVRRANIATTRAANDIFVQESPTQGGVTQLQVCNVVTVTATTTFYLNVYHTAGVDLTLPAGTSEGYINGIRAVRIA